MVNECQATSLEQGRQARGVRERDRGGVDGDRARLGVERLEDAGHEPFDSGVVEFALHRDDGLDTLVSRLNTEQRGLRGLPVVPQNEPSPIPQPGNSAHRPWPHQSTPSAPSAIALGAVAHLWRSDVVPVTPRRSRRTVVPAARSGRPHARPSRPAATHRLSDHGSGGRSTLPAAGVPEAGDQLVLTLAWALAAEGPAASAPVPQTRQ